MTTSPKTTTGPVVFGREMVHQDYEPGSTLYVLVGVEPDIALWFDDRREEWVGRVGGDDELRDDTPELVARSIESRVRSLVTDLAPLLDDSAKREVVKALGFHVCDSCNDMRAGTWEEARDVGWVHGTFGPGPDGATLCAECHAGQGSE